MARRPSVFVRPLSMDEGRKLARITRTGKNPVRMRRAIVVLMSAQGQTVRDITSLLQVSDDYMRVVIHAFNERGFDALDPKPSGGRRKKIGEQLRSWISRDRSDVPRRLGYQRVLHLVTGRTPRHRLRTGHHRRARPETLQPDPARRRHVLADHDHVEGLHRPGLHHQDAPGPRPLRSPTRRRPVVCVDEFGPLNLLPRKGKSWRVRRQPRRCGRGTPLMA